MSKIDKARSVLRSVGMANLASQMAIISFCVHGSHAVSVV